MSEEPLVLVEHHDRVATVTLNRPQQLNALSDAMLGAAVGALRELDADEHVLAIVLTGAGRAFAAGADVGELARADPIAHYEGRRGDLWDAIRAVRTPLIAAVSGYCLGGGCELAMACDLIVASETAQFGQPETGLGLVPGAGGTQRLARAVGKGLAMDVVLTGRRLSAQEALAAGLVARVVPAGAHLDEALAVACSIAEKGPAATRLAKESIDRAFEVPLQVGLDVERRSLSLALASEDTARRLRSFIDRQDARARAPEREA
jgi:enoyl-CoA hydratase